MRPEFEVLHSALREIERYQWRQPELRENHHRFLYALPHPKFDHSRPTDILLIGVNPGETAYCRRIAPGCGHQESFSDDFHAKHADPITGRRRWLSCIEKSLPSTNVVMTELFFWSTPRTKHLEERYGPLEDNPYLAFCTEMNLLLLTALEPRCVVSLEGVLRR